MSSDAERGMHVTVRWPVCVNGRNAAATRLAGVWRFPPHLVSSSATWNAGYALQVTPAHLGVPKSKEHESYA